MGTDHLEGRTCSFLCAKGPGSAAVIAVQLDADCCDWVKEARVFFVNFADSKEKGPEI